ncbi:hypothetical protein EG329_007419 [Mollisiaceae sp. DMI_Dod_QoI]|nr:hypothetical protein EG329_007419 [Helotiales sp. DMI_Dod_QoI]
MSPHLDFSRQSLFTTVRWRVIILIIFCLGFLHYVVLAPELNMLEAGHNLVSATPTWAQIIEQVSWGKEFFSSNITEEGKPLVEVAGPSTELAEGYHGLDAPAVGSQDGSLLSSYPSETGTQDEYKIHSQYIAETTTPAIPQETTSGLTDSKHPAGMDDGYAAICISIKDQRHDLPEFLTHHYYHLGIRYFYIMDDGSEPPLSEMEDFGIPRSALTFTYQDRATRDPRMQMVFYDNCLQERGQLHHWIAFFDADEFLEVTSPNETFREILEGFEKHDDVGALGVNWRMHTSSGLLTRPDSARKAFTTCIYDDQENDGASSDNRHIKSIVRPSKTASHFNPHKFRLVDGAQTVGEDGDVVSTIAWRPITRSRLALHHYAVKSRAEYEEKVHRGNGMTDPKGQQFWDHVETMPHVDCPEMAAYDP